MSGAGASKGAGTAAPQAPSGIACADRMALLGQLAAGVTHEMGSPISCVLANHAYLEERLAWLAQIEELVSRAADPEELRAAFEKGGGREAIGEARRALSDACEAAQRVLQIVQDMRVLSRDPGPLDEVVDPAEALRAAARIAAPELRPTAELVLRAADGTRVRGSPGRLIQVFVNLLVNAAQAMRAHKQRGTVVVTSRAEGDRLVVCVSDDGPGIRREHLGRVFDAFFTTKAASGGTGLGLSISRDIVASHGGMLQVESFAGHGAIFTITLPLAAAGPREHAPGAGKAARRPTETALGRAASVPPRPLGAAGRLRVLFVDDEPTLLRAYARWFTACYDVATADGGRTAIELIREGGVFDVIVCDVLMPEMSGIDLYREIRRVRPELESRFLFSTGAAPGGELDALLGAFDVPVLRKPLETRALRRAIEGRAAQPERVEPGAGRAEDGIRSSSAPA